MKNPLLKIPKLPLFDIPINMIDSAKKPYLTQLRQQFRSILLFLNSCSDKDYGFDLKSEVVGRIKNIQHGLIDTITEYFDGHPSNAFKIFERMIEENNLKDDLLANQQISIQSNNLFFRSQRQYGDIPKSFLGSSGFINFKTPFDLFHQPFERRRSVGTYRFSISGYPSLYLSKLLSTSYSECYPQDTNGAFHAVGLKNIRPLYLIDLTKDNFKKHDNLFKPISHKTSLGKVNKDDPGAIVPYLGVYQLVIASHTKVDYVPMYENETYYFKAEYIIPQFLLQWIELRGLPVDGIQYKSCTGTRKFKRIEHYNFILPVKSNLSKGYCPILKSIFYTSPVYSYCVERKNKHYLKLITDIADEISKSRFTTLA